MRPAVTYYPKTRYGVSGINEGPLMVCSMAAFEPTSESLASIAIHKSLILVIDVSASMRDVMPKIRSSILALRDLVGTIDIQLITFSDTAKVLWPNADKTSILTFDEVVGSLDVEGSTNMGDGITTAINRVDPKKATWMVVFTDGESNRGSHQSIDSFRELARRVPPNVKVITIGYGTDYNPDVLTTLGDFTYIEDAESIASVMGAISHEISVATVCGASFTYPKECGRMVVGRQSPGVVCSDRPYLAAFVPPMGASHEIEQLTFRFTVIAPGGLAFSTQDVYPAICLAREAPLEVRGGYYGAAAARRIQNLYLVAQRERSLLEHRIREVKEELKRWSEEVAVEHRETVLRIAEHLSSGRAEARTISAAKASSTMSQSSYTSALTPGARMAAASARRISDTYMSRDT